MKSYGFSADIKTIRELLSITQESLSLLTSIPRVTLARAETNEHILSDANLEKFYDFVFKKGIYLNEVRSQILLENYPLVLFHGAKSEIEGDIDLNYSRANTDFGKGFYLGETYQQAASWITNNNNSSIYSFSFDKSKLNGLSLEISNEWMIAILFYRGRLEKYKTHPAVLEIINKISKYDYIVAPIADNNMYDILESFSIGEITDEQCKHALSASNLGKQFVLLKDNAKTHLICLKRFYLCKSERDELAKKDKNRKIQAKQKADLSIIEYRRKGKYIDEIFR